MSTMDELARHLVIFFYIVAFPSALTFGWYLNTYHDKLEEHIRLQCSVDTLKQYFKWYGWRANKRPQWFILCCIDSPIECLEYIVSKFSYEDIKDYGRFSFSGDDPLLESLNLWSGEEDKYDKILLLETSYNINVEDYKYFSLYCSSREYIEWRRKKRIEKKLESLS